MHIGLLCPPGPRADDFIKAATSRGLQTPLKLSYTQFLQDPSTLSDILNQVDVLAIDTPGRGYAIWRTFYDALGRTSPIPEEHFGQIYPQDVYVDGTNMAISLASQMARERNAICTIDPEMVRICMDKAATYHAFSDLVRMPKALPEIKSCEGLTEAMDKTGSRRVFMKLRYGSAASGILAIEKLGSKLRLWTTVEKTEQGLFNSLKVKKYLDDHARHLIDDLAAMGVHTEEWIPKYQIKDRACDLRQLIIGGRTAHAIIRTSSTPFTNLHLSNRRHALSVLNHKISSHTLSHMREMAETIAQQYPKHMCLGVDIAIHKDGEQFFMLEVNSFGDYLNNVYFDGLTPRQYQIRYLERQFA